VLDLNPEVGLSPHQQEMGRAGQTEHREQQAQDDVCRTQGFRLSTHRAWRIAPSTLLSDDRILFVVLGAFAHRVMFLAINSRDLACCRIGMFAGSFMISLSEWFQMFQLVDRRDGTPGSDDRPAEHQLVETCVRL